MMAVLSDLERATIVIKAIPKDASETIIIIIK